MAKESKLREQYPEFAPDKRTLPQIKATQQALLEAQKENAAELRQARTRLRELGDAYRKARAAVLDDAAASKALADVKAARKAYEARPDSANMAALAAARSAVKADPKYTEMEAAGTKIKAAKGREERLEKNEKLIGKGLTSNQAAGESAYAAEAKKTGKSLAELKDAAGWAKVGMEVLAGVKVAEYMERFVEALNPAAVMVFNLAIKDLRAVMGVSLMPAFSVLTASIKQFANLMLPVAQEVAPVFGQIAQSVLGVMQPVMQVFATGLRYIAQGPLRLFSDILSLVTPLLQTLATGAAAFAETLTGLMLGAFGKGYQDAMSSARTAMQKLANAALVTVGALAKMAANMGFRPAGDFLKNLIEAAKGGKQKGAEGLGAATGGRVSDIRAFEREQLAAAFTATQGTKGMVTQEEFFKEALGALSSIQDGGTDVKVLLRQVGADIVDGVRAGINAILERMGLEPAFGDAVIEATRAAARAHGVRI